MIMRKIVNRNRKPMEPLIVIRSIVLSSSVTCPLLVAVVNEDDDAVGVPVGVSIEAVEKTVGKFDTEGFDVGGLVFVVGIGLHEFWSLQSSKNPRYVTT